jgi:hypothetical protein
VTASALPGSARCPTVREIALFAGVSQSSVKLVLHPHTHTGRYQPSESLRVRVVRAAEELKDRLSTQPLDPIGDYIAANRTRRQSRGRIDRLIIAMTREERHHYQMEGILPLLDPVGASAYEDFDPTPVPSGCPGCWRNGSDPCNHCPSPPSLQQLKEVRREGVAFCRWV